MRIEIDTKHDSKEELLHLANMLHAIAGASGSGFVLRPKGINRNRDIFEDPSPSAGFMNMFGSSSPSQDQESASESDAQQPTSDLFSIFGSSSAGSDEKEEDGKQKTDAQDLLDDARIVPY